jgi:hypothetical protein
MNSTKSEQKISNKINIFKPIRATARELNQMAENELQILSLIKRGNLHFAPQILMAKKFKGLFFISFY